MYVGTWFAAYRAEMGRWYSYILCYGGDAKVDADINAA